MAILGLNVKTDNPSFTIETFASLLPKFKVWSQREESQEQFNTIYEIANKNIFESIYKSKWKLAMSYYIAHYLIMFFAEESNEYDDGSLANIGRSSGTQGIVNSYSIGPVSKSMDFGSVMIDDDENKFFNRTDYGTKFVLLRKTIWMPSIFIATPRAGR